MPILMDSQAHDTTVILVNDLQETAGKERFEGKYSVSDKDVGLKAD